MLKMSRVDPGRFFCSPLPFSHIISAISPITGWNVSLSPPIRMARVKIGLCASTQWSLPARWGRHGDKNAALSATPPSWQEAGICRVHRAVGGIPQRQIWDPPVSAGSWKPWDVHLLSLHLELTLWATLWGQGASEQPCEDGVPLSQVHLLRSHCWEHLCPHSCCSYIWNVLLLTT